MAKPGDEALFVASGGQRWRLVLLGGRLFAARARIGRLRESPGRWFLAPKTVRRTVRRQRRARAPVRKSTASVIFCPAG
jgi:hypothetical protein